jgi:hypothetical protein
MLASTPIPDEGGMGLPVRIEGEAYDGERLPIAAEVQVGDDGCAYLDFGRGAMLAIWPAGSSLSDPVRLPDGTEVSEGDVVEGLATVVPFGALPGGADGWWAHVTGFCTGDAPRAVVMDEISEVR